LGIGTETIGGYRKKAQTLNANDDAFFAEEDTFSYALAA
jgi:hypothetical protein